MSCSRSSRLLSGSVVPGCWSCRYPVVPARYSGPSVKKAWTHRSPRLQFIELQRTHRVYRLAGSVSPRPTPTPEVTTVLRLSTMFLRTLREDPVDAEVASHRL